jgi:hypothetical protein
MKAQAGDRIVIRSRRVGHIEREGEILEVHGPDGTPPFLVRWYEDDHTALLFPGSDAEIRPRGTPPRTPAGGGARSTA